MRFEWDENKRKKNIDKHGLDFTDGLDVFSDPDKIELPDDRCDYGEKRIRVIGKSWVFVLLKSIVVVVVCTDRDGNIRIISVRYANRKERGLYNGND